MRQDEDLSEAEITTFGMSGTELETWKEEVQMDAIKLSHHAHSWVSESGSFSNKI